MINWNTVKATLVLFTKKLLIKNIKIIIILQHVFFLTVYIQNKKNLDNFHMQMKICIYCS